MKLSTDRILTTHVGSLPRSEAVCDLVFAKEAGRAVDSAAYEKTISEAVADVVKRQAGSGVDVVSDGEMSKISYATYIKDRLTGFEGDSPRRIPADLEAFPGYAERALRGGGPLYRRPRCTGPIRMKDLAPVRADIANLQAALGRERVVEGFMNAASPGVIAMFQPNDHYPTHEAYLAALADAMQAEYEEIHQAGLVLQIDSPDLAVGRHMMFKSDSEDEFLRHAELHVEALNHALRNVPPSQVRLHVCWGNYEGPHHCDIDLDRILPIVLKARVQILSFEAANPRHAHEWAVFKEMKLPDDKVLMPGLIDSCTNYVEHPKLVAERICRFAEIVGRERVLAGTDCGFSTFAGVGRVDPDVVYAKLNSLAEGAAIASDRLW
ncbi:MAG: cobalamin-independent methionine synthase II family protein [Proteobacteria bacterium]|nr:cobalamin-independent methionine synthase II family protein [Pseudomonadota bacterium]MBI3500112.1 cobalamin-independent methionine synthase II family protein [Pseudomonadota bacterium]